MKKLKKAETNKEYKVYLKNYKCYCITCNKRAGIFNAYCGPQSEKQNKNWKQYRKTKWK